VAAGGGAGDEPRVLRPEWVVLGGESLVPATNLARPAPEHFTHELVAHARYLLDRPGAHREPGGVLLAGTPVVVLSRDENRCRILTGSGLAVDVPAATLRELPQEP
jgi:hypothetical protein